MSFEWPDGVDEAVKWLNGVLVFSLSLAGTVVLVRLIAGNEIEILHVKVPIDRVWIAFYFLSLAHGYVTNLIMDRVGLLIKTPDPVARGRILEKLRCDSGIFTRGHLDGELERLRDGRQRLRLHADDPTLYVYAIACAFVFAAMIPWGFPRNSVELKSTIARAAGAVFLIYWNWLIGSTWRTALSTLSLRRSSDLCVAYDDLIRIGASAGGFALAALTLFKWFEGLIVAALLAVSAYYIQVRGDSATVATAVFVGLLVYAGIMFRFNWRFDWLGQSMPMKLGGFAVAAGATYLVTLAISRLQ
jgi:hypothetical protein